MIKWAGYGACGDWSATADGILFHRPNSLTHGLGPSREEPGHYLPASDPGAATLTLLEALNSRSPSRAGPGRAGRGRGGETGIQYLHYDSDISKRGLIQCNARVPLPASPLTPVSADRPRDSPSSPSRRPRMCRRRQRQAKLFRPVNVYHNRSHPVFPLPFLLISSTPCSLLTSEPACSTHSLSHLL